MEAVTFITPQIVTPPTTYPVSLAETRAQLGIETTDHDATLAGIIASATELAEVYINQALITRTYKGFLDSFPACRHIDLPRSPLQSVTHVKTYDDADAATTMDAADYYVDAASLTGRIVLRQSGSWPCVERVANGIEIQWVAGYGDDPADVPEMIRLGVMITVGWLYENRGDEAAPKTLPPAAEALLLPHRIWTV